MIRVEDYNPEWPIWFQKLHSEIWPLVKDFALSIEHVGSTSVPGLAAKPVIDLDIVVDNESNVPAVVSALDKIGYKHRGNLGIEGREAFRSPEHPVKHHLYVCLQNCAALRNHLNLRDHLRKNPEARREYSSLKRKLASDFSDSIDNYVEGNTSFITSILSKYEMSESELAAIAQANLAPKKKLIIKSEKQIAELWSDSKLLKTYKVSTAKNGLSCIEGSNCTPRGRLKVASKIGESLPIGGVLRTRVPTGEIWSKDISNPLHSSDEDLVLTRLLWLEGAEEENANTLNRFVYLHGTNQEHLLGAPASHGCIRFSNDDILELFDLLQVGNEVEVV